MRTTTALSLYNGLSRYPGPLVARWVMAKRAAKGKEDPDRIGERFGRPSAPRPLGHLIWLHAASVGESVSLLPLVSALRRSRPDLALLMTTGTRTSAEMMAKRLPAGVIHQYAPVDTAEAVRRFLDHWRPSVLAVAESELWPTMLSEARERGVRAALVSARVSERSAAAWAYAPRSIEALLGRFDLLLAQTDAIGERLRALGAPAAAVRVAGSLKDAADPLPCDPEALSEWRVRLTGRPVWLAASTHEGEEAVALDAHRALAARFPNLLTVIAPRHPERGDAVAADVAERGLALGRRSRQTPPPNAPGVYLVDALGELGLWYRLAPVALVCGSLSNKGGHNPLEPARLGAAVLFGPDMDNFSAERERLLSAGAAIETDAARLADDVGALLRPDGGRSQKAAELGAAAKRACGDGSAALNAHLAALLDLAPAAPIAAEG